MNALRLFAILWMSYISVRVVQWIFYPDPYLVSDSGEYVWSALTLQVNPYKPFGYSAFLALTRAVSAFPLGVVLFQGILKLLAVTVLANVLLRCYSMSRGLVLAICLPILIDPLAVLLDHSLMSDSLFVSVSILVLTSLLTYLKRPSLLSVAIMIFLTLVAVWIRFVGIVFPVLLLVLILLYRRRQWTIAIAAVIACTVGALVGISEQVKRDLGTADPSTFDGWAFFGNFAPVLVLDDEEIATIDDDGLQLLYEYFASFPAETYSSRHTDWHRWSPDSPAKQLLYAFGPSGYGSHPSVTVASKADSFARRLSERSVRPSSRFHRAFKTYRERFRPDSPETQPYHHAYVLVNDLLREFSRDYLSRHRADYIRGFYFKSASRLFLAEEVLDDVRYRERDDADQAVAKFWPGTDTSRWKVRFGDIGASFEKWFAWIYTLEWLACFLIFAFSLIRAAGRTTAWMRRLTGLGVMLLMFALCFGAITAYSHMTEIRYVASIIPFVILAAGFLVGRPEEPWSGTVRNPRVSWTRPLVVITALATGSLLVIGTVKVVRVVRDSARPDVFAVTGQWLVSHGGADKIAVLEDELNAPEWRWVDERRDSLKVVRIPMERESPTLSERFYDLRWFSGFEYAVLRTDLHDVYSLRPDGSPAALRFHQVIRDTWVEVAAFDGDAYRGSTLTIYANPIEETDPATRSFNTELLGTLEEVPIRYTIPFIETLGDALVTHARLEDAFALYAEAARLIPGHEPGFYSLGAVAVELGRFEEAIPALERAIDLRADRAQSHNNLGVARANLGDVEGAIAAFRQALAVDPSHERAVANLRIMEEMRDGNPEARER